MNNAGECKQIRCVISVTLKLQAVCTWIDIIDIGLVDSLWRLYVPFANYLSNFRQEKGKGYFWFLQKKLRILTGLYCWHKVHTQWHWFLWSEDEAASGKMKLMEGGRCGGRISHRRRRSWGRRPEVQDVCIICLETFSSSNPSAVLLPTSLQPY